ncbi:MAG: SH3 domain-containing protein [Anaerolineae bacterium]|nr:SH3 domain-containing protein [Anaerolineae bacterium]
MASTIRLIAVPEADQRTVRFFVTFPAQPFRDGSQAIAGGPACAPLGLFTGDPGTGQERTKILAIESFCAPSDVTWHSEQRQELASYTYASPGPHTASLRWGDALDSVTIDLTRESVTPEPELPLLTLFEVKPAPGVAQEARIRLQVAGLDAGQFVRVDAGAGHVFTLKGSAEDDQEGEWTVAYAKPGDYVITVDVLDEEGYWLGALGKSQLEISDQSDGEGPSETPAAEPDLPDEPQNDALPLADSNLPWLPFLYLRPLWAGTRTYTQPGGTQVSRSLVLGTYLASATQTTVGGALWYQSTRGDWIPASSVAVVTPSDLRGVELSETTPPPPPPPPPPGDVRYGIVTAGLLNVRARPGVAPDNPPVGQLSNGTQVTIYEERQVSGAVWYRIGDSRWVHGGWVRIVEEPPPPGDLRHGVVTATVLNVRARPGVVAGNPVVDQLRYGAEVTIYEETPYAGVPWYRIGANRWVHSGWVRIVEVAAQRASLGVLTVADQPVLPVGWVVSTSLNVRARPGISPDNPPIDEVLHNQRLDILETRVVDGGRWYRIGVDRWVYGQSVAVASERARPSAIGPNEHWVGVNLSQQTAVAYEGDRPVYAAMVATGLPGTPTVRGIFRTWQRLDHRKMSGGSAATGGYYYLEEVTWTCYFYSGYALHTAYWHDAFGRPRSHGCVNLSPYDAWWIYQWSAPGGANSPAVYVYSG